MYRQAIYYRRRTSVIFQRAALLYVAEFIIKIKHSNNIENNILPCFIKLIIFNYYNGINKVVTGKDERQFRILVMVLKNVFITAFHVTDLVGIVPTLAKYERLIHYRFNRSATNLINGVCHRHRSEIRIVVQR
ncbi:hypothetical protein NQ317_010459 [Molorchus minor]|uniref:Uncharacterized protein n=1 Tax=Molorchus minor TaxID=1323400 RepID=A0ABQ9JZ45_9CUCU|nr:hypothetical protein NQ317_010459 [Molorchus minor]